MIEANESKEMIGVYPRLDETDAGGQSPRPMSDQSNELDNNIQELQEAGDCPRNTPPPVYEEPMDSPKNTESTSTKNNQFSVDSSNFWLVGNYKKIVKKVEDGAKFCDELSQMLAERAEIESLYAKKLKAWNKKWLGSLSKGFEYGSHLESIRKGLEESNDIADIHLAIQGKISEVSSNIQGWRIDKYHKGLIGLKEAKKAEEGFLKGQKPWAKKYNDVLKGKQTYHTSCQSLDIATQQEGELKSNREREETTQDQLMKVQAKVKKATKDRDTALENYKEALRDIGNYNQKYKEDMIHEYDKWENSEMKRKDFIVEKINQFKDCIDITRFHPKMVEIYSKMSEDYLIANSSSDVQWYRKTFGPDMKFIDISFVEYDPESYLLAKGKQKTDSNQNIESNTNGKTKKKSKVCVAL